MPGGLGVSAGKGRLPNCVQTLASIQIKWLLTDSTNVREGVFLLGWGTPRSYGQYGWPAIKLPQET